MALDLGWLPTLEPGKNERLEPVIHKVWHPGPVRVFSLCQLHWVEKHTQIILPFFEDNVNISTSCGELFIYFNVP